MATPRTIICKNCRNTASIENIRYDKNGRDLICIPCYQRNPSSKTKEKPLPTRIPYICLYCNYKFTVNPESRVAKKCPYCESQNITRHDAVTTKSVLKEVSQVSQFVEFNR